MPFIDQEKGELRSIDIVAQIFPKDDDPALPPTKFMKLYIECKKRHKGTMVFYFGSREESLIKKSFIENQYENRSNLYYLSYAGIKLNEIGLSYEIGAFIAGVSIAAGPIAFYISESLKPIRDFFLVLFLS